MEFNTEKQVDNYTYKYNTSLTPKTKKGLDLVGRALNKKYPFITGNISLWGNTNELYSSIPLEVEVNFDMFVEYINGHKDSLSDSLGFLSTLVFNNNQEIIDHAKSIDIKIKKDITRFYQNLPDDFRIQYQIKFDWSDHFKQYPSEVYIMNFINI